MFVKCINVGGTHKNIKEVILCVCVPSVSSKLSKVSKEDWLRKMMIRKEERE